MSIIIAFVSGAVCMWVFINTFVKITYRTGFILGKTSGYFSGFIKGMKLIKEKNKKEISNG